MAQIPYRANLSAAIYPFALSRSGRSVIIPQADQNYDRRVDPSGEQKTPGIPQAIYLENVLPTPEGYMAIGKELLPNLPWTGTTQILQIRSAKTNDIEIIAFQAGTLNARRWTGTSWQLIVVSNAVGAPTFSGVTSYSYAVVRGKIYIFDGDNLWDYQMLGGSWPYSSALYRVDGITLNIAVVTPAGAMDNLRYITSSYNYLIFVKDDGTEISLLWSSQLLETDFTPSLSTGAGGGAASDAQGRLAFASQGPAGFYIYCTGNVLFASYTGNARYPFRLRPVNSAPGAPGAGRIYYEPDEESQYYITRHNNLVAVTGETAQPIGSEMAEFLERRIPFDVFDYATNTFSLEQVNDVSERYSVHVFANRYICVSSEPEELTGSRVQYKALYVYDAFLQRYGKLKITHTQIIATPIGSSTRQTKLGFLNQHTGEFCVWNFDASAVNGVNFPAFKSVLVLGKIQYVRSRNLILEEIDVESATGSKESLEVLVLPSWDGKNFNPALNLYEKTSSTKEVKSYLAHKEGKNISILVKGAFDISSVSMLFHPGGDS